MLGTALLFWIRQLGRQMIRTPIKSYVESSHGLSLPLTYANPYQSLHLVSFGGILSEGWKDTS
jgi:hypothetical protein